MKSDSKTKTEAAPTYTFEVAGGAVLSIEGNILTFSGIYEGETEANEMAPCVKVRVNDGKRTKVFEGNILQLKAEKEVIISGFKLPRNKREMGRIYLDWVLEDIEAEE